MMSSSRRGGQLRAHGKDQMDAIDVLEKDVTDSSDTQSATAVSDKISAATLIQTRQKQSRVQLLAEAGDHWAASRGSPNTSSTRWTVMQSKKRAPGVVSVKIVMRESLADRSRPVRHCRTPARRPVTRTKDAG
jgi:hypothetical protein